MPLLKLLAVALYLPVLVRAESCTAATAGLTASNTGSGSTTYYRVTTNAQLLGLSTCTSIDYLWIDRVDCTQSEWCGLQLQSITGKDPWYGRSLYLYSIPSISDMCGVKNVKGALTGGFQVDTMNGLASLDGAEGITSVGVGKSGSSILLYGNPILTSAIALANAEYPAGTLNIQSNTNLECVPSAWPATDGATPQNTIPHGSCPTTPAPTPAPGEGGSSSSGGLPTGGIIGAVAVVALLLACVIKRRRQRGKQQGANVGDGGGQELSVFSAVTKAMSSSFRSSNLSSSRQSSDLSGSFVLNPTSATMTGTLSKKGGGGSSRWGNCFFSINTQTRVLSWQTGKTAKSRLGHMRVEELFKLPERDGKRSHRFDVAGTVVTVAQEQTCQQTIQKRCDELQHAHDALSAGLTAGTVLAAGGSNPGVEQSADAPSTTGGPSIAEQIELAKKAKDTNTLSSDMRLYLAAEQALAAAEQGLAALMRYESGAGEKIIFLSANTDDDRSAWIENLIAGCEGDERPLALHPEYKAEWVVGMLATEINTVEKQLNAGVTAKQFHECEALQRQLDILQVKKSDAEKLQGQFKLAHGAEKQELVTQLEELRLSAKDLAVIEAPSGGGGGGGGGGGVVAGGSAQAVGKQGSADAEIEFGSLSNLGSIEGRSPISDKFVANKMIVGQPAHAAHGLVNFMGISSEREGEIKQQGLKAIRAEFHHLEDTLRVSGSATEKQEAAKHLAIVLYILDEAASELEEKSNDGKSTIVRDEGHDGMRLADFKQHPDAVAAKLEDTHVAALRIYTSQAFGRINWPLRNEEQPHPFAATTLFISEGLKQLRAVHAVGGRATQTNEFWRGMKDLVLTDDFIKNGGTELGCMSTSTKKDIVANYAMSHQPLVFRVISDGFMSCGADISWLSMYPAEKEILYPPLTYLKCVRVTKIKNSAGVIVDVSPHFS
jgi:hypothetical protein